MERVPKKLKTGLTTPISYQENIFKSFINAFLAVIWRHNYVTAVTYSHHNNCKVTPEILLQTITWNIFHQDGLGKQIQPYFKKAMFTGELLEDDVKDNPHLIRVLTVFKDAYINETTSSNHGWDFCCKYGRSIFDMNVKDLALEIRSLEEVVNTEEQMKTIKLRNVIEDFSKECECNLCSSIRSYDGTIQEGKGDDPYLNIITQGLLRSLK